MLCKITKIADGYPEQSRVLALPKTDQSLTMILMDMGIGSDNNFDCAVSDVRTGNAHLDEFFAERIASVDELNYIAKFTHSFSQNDMDKLGSIVATAEPEHTVGFINLMNEWKNFTFYDNAATLEQLGMKVAERLDGVDSESPLGQCVDFERYGESYDSAHGGTFIDNGYVVSEGSRNIVYSGLYLPSIDAEVPDVKPLSVKLTTLDWLAAELLDDPYTEALSLPATEWEIDKALSKLAEISKGKPIVCSKDSQSRTVNCSGETSLYDINALAEVYALEGLLSPTRGAKLKAILAYEDGGSVADIVNAAFNLDSYDFKENIQSPEEFIADYYDNDLIKIARGNELDAEKLMRESGGKITQYGYVARNDKPIEQIYEPREPGKQSSMAMRGL